MNILKNFIQFVILFTHISILVWGTVEFNPYRLQIMDTLTVPQNSLINEFYFLSLLSMYMSSNSLLTFIYEFGRNFTNFYYHLLNFISIFSLMIINYLDFKKCREDCVQILNDDYIYFKGFYEYLPYMQLNLVLFYLAYMIYVLRKNNQALLMEDEFDEVFMESPVMNQGIINLDEDSSSPEALNL